MLNKIKPYQIIVAVLVTIAVVVVLVSLDNRNQQQANTTVEALPAPNLQAVDKIAIQPKAPIQVYGGGRKTKTKLKLPPSVVNNERAHIIAGTKVKADDHPQTVTTVLDETTGESITYITKEPLPWLEVDLRGSAGIYAGIKNGEQAVRLQLDQNLINIKAVHIKAIASVDQTLSTQQQDYFVGVGAEVRW